MKKALAYLRKSTNQKDKQVLSLETQKNEILKAHHRAEEYFGEPVEIIEWIEEKISGTNESRPEFQRMCERFRKKEADILLSWKLDRLSRNHMDSAELMTAVQKGIIPLIQDSEKLWTRRESGIYMAIAFGLAAEESMQNAERSSLGTQTLIRKGGAPIKAPFGYKNIRDKSIPVDGRIILDPVASRFAKKMFEMRVAGKSYRELSAFLFDHGYKSKTGGKINSSTIEGWIRNKFYYGIIEYRDEVWKHIYPPIITRDLYDCANSVGRGNTPRLQKDSFPLKGVVKSAISLRPLTASLAKKIYPQYHTHSRWKNDNVSISEALLLDLFEQELLSYRIPKEVKPYIMQAIRDFYSVQIEEIEKDRTFFIGEITKTSNKLDGLIDMRIGGELTPEQFAKKQKEYTENLVTLQEKLDKIVRVDEQILTSISESVELLTNLSQYWKNADTTKKCEIVKCIVVELLVDSEKRLYIKENEVFEALRFLNCTEWSPIRSNGRTMGDESPLMKLAEYFIQNQEICKKIISIK